MKYHDKNGNEIKAGMTLKHDDGTTHFVYECEDENGELDLGFNASNETWLEKYGAKREIYPLHQFTISEYVIVND